MIQVTWPNSIPLQSLARMSLVTARQFNDIGHYRLFGEQLSAFREIFCYTISGHALDGRL